MRLRPWIALSLTALACNGQTSTNAPGRTGNSESGAPATGGQSGKGGAASGGSSDGSRAGGGPAACPQCPSQPSLDACCEQYCGYRNDALGECVPSLVGGRTLVVTAYPDGELCVPKDRCQQSPSCPSKTPAEDSACGDAMTCHFCFQRNLPRTMTCHGGTWSTVGPNSYCAYTQDPVP